MKSVAGSRIGACESLVSDATGSERVGSAETKLGSESGSGLIGLALMAVSASALFEALHQIASSVSVPTRSEILHFLGVPPGAFFF